MFCLWDCFSLEQEVGNVLKLSPSGWLHCNAHNRSLQGKCMRNTRQILLLALLDGCCAALAGELPRRGDALQEGLDWHSQHQQGIYVTWANMDQILVLVLISHLGRGALGSLTGMGLIDNQGMVGHWRAGLLLRTTWADG